MKKGVLIAIAVVVIVLILALVIGKGGNGGETAAGSQEATAAEIEQWTKQEWVQKMGIDPQVAARMSEQDFEAAKQELVEEARAREAD
jgi:hypothetical protein